MPSPLPPPRELSLIREAMKGQEDCQNSHPTSKNLTTSRVSTEGNIDRLERPSAQTHSKDSPATMTEAFPPRELRGLASWHSGRRHFRCTICLSQCTSFQDDF